MRRRGVGERRPAGGRYQRFSTLTTSYWVEGVGGVPKRALTV
jgi:hypothetical protein